MIVTVNGDNREIPEGTSVRGLLELLNLASAAAAVEINRRLVRKADHATTTLKPGDTIEIVTLVGGG
ncbi:MAG: sulfur carrier protein ThiS [Phycisphaerales bacterium]|nr:sulfur carrier protein ThiS [Phycisphaerales bacterium]